MFVAICSSERTDHLSLLCVHVSSNTVYDVRLRELGSVTVFHISRQHPEREGERDGAKEEEGLEEEGGLEVR